MLSRWRQSLDTISLRDLWDENERKWKMDERERTNDRPTHKHSHKRKRLLRASDENHFPTEIQIFMLSIRSSWNYYRPITSLFLFLSLSWWECIEKWVRFGRNKITKKKKNMIFYTHFANSFKTVYSRVIIVIGNCV